MRDPTETVDTQWIVGVDCAVQPKNVAVALGKLTLTGLDLIDVRACPKRCNPVAVVVELLQGKEKILLALDAPLGWPSAMGDRLTEHSAGEWIETPPDDLFRRATDKFIKREIGCQPLDVGADRIARTAVAALALLHDVAIASGRSVELMWSPTAIATDLAAIEVYPAATLLAHGLPSTRYKKRDQLEIRRSSLGGLRQRMSLGEYEQLLLSNAHALDAAVCVLAGFDFLGGEASEPENVELAMKEGWIWVKRGNASTLSGPPQPTSRRPAP